MHFALLSLSLLTAAPASATPSSAASTAPVEVVPFIENDYPRALAEAQAKKLPLFVDVWAPWCHTCRFMRAYVFSDPALAPQAGKFVWLSLDTEQEKNAAFVQKFPIDAWPTLMVIDPRSQKMTLKWLGSANVHDLTGILDDGARALDPSHAGAEAQLLAQADAADARGDHALAVKSYREALAAGGPNWPDAPRVLQSLDFALQLSGDLEGCARLARERASTIPQGGAYANLVATGLQCAADSPPSPARDESLHQLQPLAEAALKIPDLLADDRSGIYETLVDLREQAHDDAGKKKLAAEWLAFLEGQAAKATTPETRAAFDPHRVLAAIAMGDPARALPAVQQSERDLPDDYNPPARQALLYLELGKLDEALAANDRALAKVYGPRTLRVLDNRVAILQRMKRNPDALAALDRAITFANGLPAGAVSPKSIEHFKKERADLASAK